MSSLYPPNPTPLPPSPQHTLCQHLLRFHLSGIFHSTLVASERRLEVMVSTQLPEAGTS
jgi:hypothetical protein